MQERQFTEKDWKLFRKKIINWQEDYMGQLNKQYIELLSSNACPSEKFWSLNKKVKIDKKKTGVQVEMSRSKLIINIISLINEGVITFEDLEEFSTELRDTVRYIIK